MQNDENACIRYLMKEMDPSEEVLMERAMMEDEDLLIEVESMRKTLGRLDELPRKEPSPQLTDSIVHKAGAHRQKVLSSGFSLRPFIRFAAAAAVLVSMSFGGYYAYEYMAASSQEAEPSGGPPSLTGGQSSGSGQQGGEVAPWVDRNDVLRLEQNGGETSQEFDSVFRNATRKLTPLNDPFFRGSDTRTLQLTGSGSN